MGNKRSSNKSSKKVPIIIIGVLVLIIAAAVGVFMSKSKLGEANDNVDIEESTKAKIEQKVEYGDDIKDITFRINTENGEKEAKLVDLNPEVDTMKVGKTEHNLELKDEEFEVTVIIEDTQKPVIKGVKDVIELKGEKVNVEKELNKLITAEDPVDGKVEVIFDINKDEKKEYNYNVIASATDKNNNNVSEKFEVILKNDKKKDEKAKDGKESNSKEESGNNDKSSSSNSNASKESQSDSNATADKSNKGNSNSDSTKPKPKPKEEAKPKSKPKEEVKPKPKEETESDTASLGKPSSAIPGGTSVIDSGSDYIHYSYGTTLSGKGKIQEVGVSIPGPGRLSVMIIGLDIDGNEFMTKKESVGANMSYMFGAPNFTDDDFMTIDSVAVQFLKAYGR